MQKYHEMTCKQFIQSDYFYYLNIAELRRVCAYLKIDILIYLKINQQLKKSSIRWYKKDMIDGIRKKINGKYVGKIIYPSQVINYSTKKLYRTNDPIYYGQYKNGNKNILTLMKKLTDSRFSYGSVSIDLLHNAWKKGKILTYGQLAALWIKKTSNRTIKKEWKYLTDLHNKTINKHQWKKYRKDIAKHFIGDFFSTKLCTV